METKQNEFITDKVIDGLKKAIVEIEEFRVQLALGKLETKDAYEDAKKKFSLKIHELKHKIDSAKTSTDEHLLKAKGIFEELQVQLALGKAETKDRFEEQRKTILHLLHELENHIKNNKTANEYYSHLQTEIEKFKIKLNILSLNYELKKIEVVDEFEGRKMEFLHKMETLKQKLHLTEKSKDAKFEHFRNEMNEGYTHLKKAFHFK